MILVPCAAGVVKFYNWFEQNGSSTLNAYEYVVCDGDRQAKQLRFLKWDLFRIQNGYVIFSWLSIFNLILIIPNLKGRDCISIMKWAVNPWGTIRVGLMIDDYLDKI